MVNTRAASVKGSRQGSENQSVKKHAKSTTPKTKAEARSKTNPAAARGNQLDDPKSKADALDKMNHLLSRLSSSSSTICPSQIARGLNKDDSARYPDWRAMMNFTRGVVWEQVRDGRVQVTQGGEVREYEQRDLLTGPIRVRRGPEWTSAGS
jgi:hypothetical protein